VATLTAVSTNHFELTIWPNRSMFSTYKGIVSGKPCCIATGQIRSSCHSIFGLVLEEHLVKVGERLVRGAGCVCSEQGLHPGSVGPHCDEDDGVHALEGVDPLAPFAAGREACKGAQR